MTASSIAVACALCSFAPSQQCAECALVAERIETARLRVEVELLRSEVTRLEGRVTDLDSGISIRGWWCTAERGLDGGPCQAWNGEEHSVRTTCRRCGTAKADRPVRS